MEPQSQSELWAAYREELHRQRMVPYLRTMAFAVFLINSAFIFLDRYAFPQAFASFLPVRLTLDAILAWVFFHGSRVHAVGSKWAICLSTIGMLMVVIHGTGAAESEYYVGLILLLVAMPVLLPMTAWDCAVLSALPLLGFGLFGLLPADGIDWRTYVIHLLFLTSAAFLSVASAALLDRVRFTDYARRKEVERARDELRELDRAKSRFTANVHHELRTPLTLILAPLEALLSGELGEVPEALRAELATMRANALRLLKLINDLLELARIESGALRIQRQPVRVGERIAQLVRDVQPLAERRGIELRTQGLERLPLLPVDPDALERIFVNLLGNAIKFTQAGGRVEVRGEVSLSGVELCVADTGIGIPPDQLERIFDRFAQVDGSATRVYEGSGIGLSLVRELVELHGGSIRAESEGPGRGTRMHVWLPFAAVPDSGSSLVEGQPTAGPASTSSWALGLEAELGHRVGDGDSAREAEGGAASRIDEAPPAADADALERADVLVVEDNEAMRTLLARLLSAEFRVRQARDGQDALEQLGRRLPDLVITDVMMPRLSGIDLCRRLKQDAATRAVPVMLVTSKAEREMKIEGLELGADDYVVKPFHPRELLARARALVRMRLLQRQLAERNAELERILSELTEAEVKLVQAERLAAVGELAAGVAHEVNNPVNFAMNSLATLRTAVGEVRRFAQELARVDWSDASRAREAAERLNALRSELELEEQVEMLEELTGIVTEGLERTHRLVADLRDFGAPHAGEAVPFCLRESVESTLRLLRGELRRAGIELETRFEEGLPRVRGDRSALNQLCLNLLKNALQALEKTGGTLLVELRREEGSIVLCVADDGPGIPPEVQERLFEPFFTTKAPGRGTGLGLSICRRIVEAHGGSIEVDSKPGEGTAFRVRLPAEAEDATS